jgi:hypothetical protein
MTPKGSKNRMFQRFTKITGLATAVVGISLIATLLPIPNKAPGSPINARHIRFVTSAGASLPTFFADLPPNPKRLVAFTRNSKNGTERGCRSEGSLLSKITGLFTGVVHAQPPQECSPLPRCQDCLSIVQEIGCSECDGSDFFSNEWFGDVYPTGWNFNDILTCHGTCCALAECSC